jgi:hypothetical protein
VSILTIASVSERLSLFVHFGLFDFEIVLIVLLLRFGSSVCIRFDSVLIYCSVLFVIILR